MPEVGNNQGSTGKDRFQAEFEALPLDQKFAKLFKMEAAAIGEAIQYAVNSPMKVVDNVADALTKVGERIESEFKKATCKPPADASSHTPPPPPPEAKKPRAGKRPPGPAVG